MDIYVGGFDLSAVAFFPAMSLDLLHIPKSINGLDFGSRGPTLLHISCTVLGKLLKPLYSSVSSSVK